MWHYLQVWPLFHYVAAYNHDGTVSPLQVYALSGETIAGSIPVRSKQDKRGAPHETQEDD
jgi:hypothetical protein